MYEPSSQQYRLHSQAYMQHSSVEVRVIAPVLSEACMCICTANGRVSVAGCDADAKAVLLRCAYTNSQQAGFSYVFFFAVFSCALFYVGFSYVLFCDK
jgi:hypothetical protein